MFQKYHLRNEAIPAGIFLLLAAAAMFLHHAILPFLNDRVMYGIGGLLVVVSILLFTRQRNAACGVFFIILTVISAIGIIAWVMEKTIVPLPYYYGAKTLCFLGLSVVCLRRRKEPKSGPWFVSVCIYVIALPLLFIYGLQEPAIPNKLIIYLGVTDLLLFIGLLLTAIAFRYAPEGEQTNPQSQRTPANETDSKTPSSFSGMDAENIKTGTTQPAPEPSEPAQQETPKKEVFQPEHVETAQVEWLEDD